ncbi:C4-dicarboxylate ABC transporter substrate-binding protein [Marinomonas rhizomae]|uniref:TRAP-type C4-dicarboxylate transport system substrate-binding protein n=1 Tax=Marinomonas rhizomae TaxID=491948 RepID=A0A366J2F1_9GAMM|nr:TRAP transporter substrate-binding protein [Marinomonas rhizomae]RBP80499.1 TRAP-type C4-dicarboxylate transport system substrate-binding protein [Marinomonas rhizomae]RNF71736.1 C4-dicarboxylate ABC transporter substrate-binding protein [Marinomonas rhizomae]
MMNFKKNLLCVTAGAVLSLSAAAAETTLRVATWLPPTNPQNATVWPTWKKWVEEATEGRVEVVIENYTGHPKTIYDAVEDGIYDVGFSVEAYLPGRFKLSGVAEIPGEITDAETGSVALWRTYKDYFEPADEYEGFQLLGLFVHGPGQLHTKFPVNSLDDLKDKKMRVGGGLVNDLAERLEVTPVSAPSPKSYEMMQQGVVDGTFLPAQEQKFFRLSEISTDLTLFPKGLYTTAFSIVMNQDVFEGLSTKDQQAIMSVSGERLSQLAGAAWGKADDNGILEAKEKGVNVVFLAENDQRVKDLNKLAEGIDQIWVDSVTDRDVDAKAALADFRKYVDDINSKK